MFSQFESNCLTPVTSNCWLSTVFVPPLSQTCEPPRVGLPLLMPPITQLTVTEIFAALNSYISNKIHRTFKPIFIYDVKMFDAFVYTLTTCYERRYTKWRVDALQAR